MKLRLLLEEIVKQFKSPYTNVKVIVHKNPASEEIDEVSERLKSGTYVRFIADPSTKDLYVFTPEALHRSVSKRLGGGELPNKELWGTAKKTAGGWKAVASDAVGYGGRSYAKRISSQKWDWVQGISVRSLLKSIDSVLDKRVFSKKPSDLSSEELEPMVFARDKQ